MAKKTSANAKARYTTYANSNTAAKNKAARAERHSKAHPNDTQPGGLKGCTQDMTNRPTKFEASIRRAVQHDLLFGQEKGHVKGRDLSTSMARKSFLKSLKTETSTKKKAA